VGYDAHPACAPLTDCVEEKHEELHCLIERTAVSEFRLAFPCRLALASRFRDPKSIE
jgi:hypothetical protein